jgi:hypothetical protein
VPLEPSPQWTRALAWSAAYAGVSSADVADTIDPSLRDGLVARLDSFPRGDARARAAALHAARRAWLRADEGGLDGAALATLGARVIASLLAATPASARASLARSFEAASLRAVTAELPRARACDPIALAAAIDRLTRVTGAPSGASAVGALAFGALRDEGDLAREVQRALRSLRATGAHPSAVFAPFRPDVDSLFSLENRR